MKQYPNSPQSKIFVLDTSVILFDHTAIYQFQEHDIILPITILEELDNFKKGHDSKNFEARAFIRYLEKLTETIANDWMPIGSSATGWVKIEMEHHSPKINASKIFEDNKNDHKILNTALYAQEKFPKRQVILVSKDVNLRLKAKSLGLQAEDYLTGQVKNIDELYTGMTEVSRVKQKIIDDLYEQDFIAEGVGKKYRKNNHFYILKSGKKGALATFDANKDGFRRIEKRDVYGIKPKNAEQTFAMDALLNKDIKLVTLQGVAGTGKTLLALSCALEQRLYYPQIYLARPAVPLSNKDIGYLPGDIKSKLNPYMEPLWDNLKFIQSRFNKEHKNNKVIDHLVQSEGLTITPLAYVRGRSLSNTFFIVDEAQNLTPHEIKTIITRAGEGTKIIFTGDVNQIDTPYLDATSNGLSYVIDRLKEQQLFAHITLTKGERSELANLASELL